MTKKIITIVIDERVEGLEPLGSAVSALEYDGFIVEDSTIHEVGHDLVAKLVKHIEAEKEAFDESWKGYDSYDVGDDILVDKELAKDESYILGMEYALSILKGGN